MSISPKFDPVTYESLDLSDLDLTEHDIAIEDQGEEEGND